MNESVYLTLREQRGRVDENYHSIFMTRNVYTLRKRFLIVNSREENGNENKLQSMASIQA